MNLPDTWIDSVQESAPPDKLILDVDSSESETYGDLERAMRRRGIHGSVEFWCQIPLPADSTSQGGNRAILMKRRLIGPPENAAE